MSDALSQPLPVRKVVLVCGDRLDPGTVEIILQGRVPSSASSGGAFADGPSAIGS